MVPVMGHVQMPFARASIDIWICRKDLSTILTLLFVCAYQCKTLFSELIVLGFNDTSTLVCHFVLSPREREKKR